MSVELPKDAEGREIPLDTKVLYNEDGNDFYTDRATYMRLTEDWWFFGHFGSHTDTHRIAAADLYLTPPDSWEKLLEDLDRALSPKDPDTYASMTCGYFDSVNSYCRECEKKNGIDCEECNDAAWRDIASRIRKLRGEG